MEAAHDVHAVAHAEGIGQGADAAAGQAALDLVAEIFQQLQEARLIALQVGIAVGYQLNAAVVLKEVAQ